MQPTGFALSKTNSSHRIDCARRLGNQQRRVDVEARAGSRNVRESVERLVENVWSRAGTS